MFKLYLTIIFALFIFITYGQLLPAKNLYQFDSTSTPRWASFENPTAEKGKAAMENHGAKGHPSDEINAGETKVLLNTKIQTRTRKIMIVDAARIAVAQ